MVNKNLKSDHELYENGKLILDGLAVHNNKFSGKSVLITGAAGFLGTQFAYYFDCLNNSSFIEKPITVYLWDNFVRGYLIGLKNLKLRRTLLLKKKI